MFAGVAVPRYANSLALQRTDAAVRRIVADLNLVQRRARLTGKQQTVTFDVAGDTYSVGDLQDPDHPANPYVVNLSKPPYDAAIVSVDFGGDTALVFDGYGTPDSGGSIVIEVGRYQQTITLSDADLADGLIKFKGLLKPTVK